MKRRRTRSTVPHNFHHKYLKPGALARIRDSKISARSHHLNKLSQICINRSPSPPMSPFSTVAQTQTTAPDGFPFFVARINGPRCPQRKKLVAAKSVFFAPFSPTSDSPDLVIDSFGGDTIAAN